MKQVSAGAIFHALVVLVMICTKDEQLQGCTAQSPQK